MYPCRPVWSYENDRQREIDSSGGELLGCVTISHRTEILDDDGDDVKNDDGDDDIMAMMMTTMLTGTRGRFSRECLSENTQGVFAITWQ